MVKCKVYSNVNMVIRKERNFQGEKKERKIIKMENDQYVV